MNNQEIESWTCQQLIINVLHELNQDTNVASTYLEVLLHEEGYGFVSEGQKKMLTLLQDKIKDICVVTEVLDIWFSAHQDDTEVTSSNL